MGGGVDVLELRDPASSSHADPLTSGASPVVVVDGRLGALDPTTGEIRPLELTDDGRLKVEAVTPLGVFTEGIALALVPGQTAAIVRVIGLAETSYSVTGFTVSGETDARVALRIDGTAVSFTRLNVWQPSDAVSLPRAIPLPEGSEVTLEVTNIGMGTAGYWATILGEVPRT